VLGSRSIISLIDLLACSLASMIILAVTFMANRDSARLGAFPGRSFVLRVVSEDPGALLALVAQQPNASAMTELRPAVRGIQDDGCGPLQGERCLLAGWSLAGDERIAPAAGSGRQYVAAFPQPTAGPWTIGVRFFSRAGGAREWPIGIVPSTTLAAFEVAGVPTNPCARLVGTTLAIGEVALCDEFLVELAE
jgi:hypothetical protein